MLVRKNNRYILTRLILFFACICIAFPVFFAIVKATQSRSDVISASLIPGNQLGKNLYTVFFTHSLLRYMFNSLFIAITVTIGKTIFSLFTALVLVFFNFKHKNILFIFILITLLMPTEVLIVGLFDIVSLQPPKTFSAFFASFTKLKTLFFLEPTRYGFGWTNSYLSLIVPFMASATGIFLFRQHFLSIPRDIADAARIDGLGPIGFLRTMLLPLSTNTIGALAVIQFVYVWDQYLWPRVIIRDDSKQVIQVGLKLLVGSGEGVNWGTVMAGTVVSIIPPLLIFFILQKQFMKGFVLSEDK